MQSIYFIQYRTKYLYGDILWETNVELNGLPWIPFTDKYMPLNELPCERWPAALADRYTGGETSAITLMKDGTYNGVLLSETSQGL